MTETDDRLAGSRTRRTAKAASRGKGLKIKRVFTTAGVHPYDEVTWERRDVVMTNWRDGSINFEQRGVEFPEFWTVNAVNIVTSKYFRGAVGTPQREVSLRQLIDRIVKTYRKAGEDNKYFASPADAVDHIAGYVLSHDVSEREFQLERGGQWDKGKSCETFNPLGPELVTADEVADPQDLRLTLSVNGVARQDGTTADMIFGVDHVIWYLSQFMVLEPGDVINTGTPAGVALGLPDHPYLKAGDVVELEITGLGRAVQTFAQATR